MPKQFNIKVNKFDRGFITESSPLNFPDGASVSEENLAIAPDGTRERRLGIDFEDGFALVKTGFTAAQLIDKFISFHRWKSPGNDPTLDIGVVCAGNRLYFFDMTKENPSAFQLNLGNYVTVPNSGTEGAVSGTVINGFLVLASNAFNYPVVVEYDKSQDSISLTQIQLKIRDLQGVDDTLPLSLRPQNLSLEHKYNLLNQGWTSVIETVPDGTSEVQFIEARRGVGGESGNATWGGITFYVDEHAPGSGIDWVAAALNNQIPEGCNFPVKTTVVSTNRCLITFDPRDGQQPQHDFTAGRCLWNDCDIISGRITAGTTTPYGDVYSYIKTKLGVYPSNCDIVSLGLVPDDTSLYYNKFDVDTFNKNTGYLNLGEAPKGHIIIDAMYRAGSRGAAVPGVKSDSDSSSVGTCCGHAGRMFYAGVNGETLDRDARTINSQSIVYFSQIITDKTKLERCYQENDPTDQRQFELAAGDGGTIFIPGCNGIVHLESFGNSVIVFSINGIWEITGGSVPFSATSYSVNKLAKLACISPKSVVFVEDGVVFWAKEGIYLLKRNEYGQIEVSSISDTTIQTWCNSLSEEIKSTITGYYDSRTSTVRWIIQGAKEVTDEGDVIITYSGRMPTFYKYNLSISEGTPYNMSLDRKLISPLATTYSQLDLCLTQCGVPLAVFSDKSVLYSIDKGKTWSSISTLFGPIKTMSHYGWCEHNGGVLQPQAVELLGGFTQPAFSADGINWSSFPRHTSDFSPEIILSHNGKIFTGGSQGMTSVMSPDGSNAISISTYDGDIGDKGLIHLRQMTGRAVIAISPDFAILCGTTDRNGGGYPKIQEWHNGVIGYSVTFTDLGAEGFVGMYVFNNDVFVVASNGMILRRAGVDSWVPHTSIPAGTNLTGFSSSGTAIILNTTKGTLQSGFTSHVYISYNGRTFRELLSTPDNLLGPNFALAWGVVL